MCESRRFLRPAVIAMSCLSASIAGASDHGCKVLLCLANPAGPRAVAECRPDIDQLFSDLARGRPFPTCDMASSPDGSNRSWAQQGVSYYDLCPTGTTALPSGEHAIQGSASASTDVSGYGPTLFTGIGEGDGQSGGGEDLIPMTGKVCVGNKVGDVSVSVGAGESSSSVMTGVFDRVVMLDAQGSPRIIDVFINSTLYRRVRW